MPSARLPNWLLGGMVAALLMGCATTIPASLARRVSWHVGFRDLHHDPTAYRGQVVALGGIVSQIEFLATNYRVAVREFPLDGSAMHRPAIKPPSGGIFLLRFAIGELPGNVQPGAEITVVGEVLGKGIFWGYGEAEEVPLLAPQHIHVWGASWRPRIQIGLGGSFSP
ncbi:MAG TPA: Slp family lipoprotein [Alphaproteobacteria bacterium]|nr:Slp family lipoprotein [Alphaproteobacteria bacterium]